MGNKLFTFYFVTAARLIIIINYSFKRYGTTVASFLLYGSWGRNSFSVRTKYASRRRRVSNKNG